MAQVTITIPNEDLSDFKKYYLIRRPKPEREPPISDNNWIKERIITDIRQVLVEGKQMEALNELDIDIEIT